MKKLPVPKPKTSKQCNNAKLFHSAIEFDPEVVDNFERITCAQRVIRCKGRCSANSPAVADSALKE